MRLKADESAQKGLKMEFINGENIAVILFLAGLYGVIARRNIIKTIISLGIMDVAAILFFVSINHSPEAVPPIGRPEELSGIAVSDPLPQALMITAIVIGIGVTAVCLTMFNNLYHTYGTTNWSKAFSKREQSDD